MVEISKKDNVKNAICYIPLVAIVLYFVEKNTSVDFLKNRNYGIILFILLIIINTILNIFFLGFLAYIAILGYIIISVYFAFKAWNGYEIKVEILDKIESETLSKIK